MHSISNGQIFRLLGIPMGFRISLHKGGSETLANLTKCSISGNNKTISPLKGFHYSYCSIEECDLSNHGSENLRLKFTEIAGQKSLMRSGLTQNKRLR